MSERCPMRKHSHSLKNYKNQVDCLKSAGADYKNAAHISLKHQDILEILVLFAV